jgi:hypothetical protein
MIPRRVKSTGKLWLWLLAAFGLAWAGGYVARQAESAPAEEPLADETDLRRSAIARSTPLVAPFTTPGWGLSGGLELADLMALPAGMLRRMETAMWVGRARPEELAEWWSALVAENPQDWGLLDLLMIRWMELAPDEALAVVAGTPEEYLAWMAWGRINPRLAAREAEARGSGFLWRVLQGAGYGDPVTARELLAEYPAFGYPAVKNAIQQGLKNLGWLEALEFAYDGKLLESWAAHEPEKAYEWALKHDAKISQETWRNLGANHGNDPDRFNKILETIPSGQMRQRLMLAQVEFLAARDLDAAISFAQSADSPMLRNRLLAALGQELTVRDPQRSFELFREFTESGGINSGMQVMHPNGSSFFPNTDTPEREWLRSLIKQNPQAAYDLTRETNLSRERVYLHWQVSDLWLSEDRHGFAAHLHEQPPGVHRDEAFIRAASIIVKQSDGRQLNGTQIPVRETMAEVMDWIAAVDEAPKREIHSTILIHEWLERDAPSAAEFFGDSGPANSEQRALYSKLKGADP